ncbi:hypothetical protein Agub_g3508, partial [Astrephomene gubernaculifera]
ERVRSVWRGRLLGIDVHEGALSLAERQARKAGVYSMLELTHGDCGSVQPPAVPQLVVCNPPWGARLLGGSGEVGGRGGRDGRGSRDRRGMQEAEEEAERYRGEHGGAGGVDVGRRWLEQQQQRQGGHSELYTWNSASRSFELFTPSAAAASSSSSASSSPSSSSSYTGTSSDGPSGFAERGGAGDREAEEGGGEVEEDVEEEQEERGEGEAEEAALEAAWRSLDGFLYRQCPGASAFVLSGNPAPFRHLRLKPHVKRRLVLSGVDVRVAGYRIRDAASRAAAAAATAAAATADNTDTGPSADTSTSDEAISPSTDGSSSSSNRRRSSSSSSTGSSASSTETATVVSARSARRAAAASKDSLSRTFSSSRSGGVSSGAAAELAAATVRADAYAVDEGYWESD